MNRELTRLQVHIPCSYGIEIGVFASPIGQRRNTRPSLRAGVHSGATPLHVGGTGGVPSP